MSEPTESSPLLVTEDNNLEENAGEGDITSFPGITTYSAAGDFFPRPIKILTKSILITTIFAFIILLASEVLISKAPFKRVPYNAGANKVLGAFVLVALIAAVINLHFKVLILLNLLMDIFLTLNILSWVPVCFSYGFPTDNWCYPRFPPVEPQPVPSGCLDWVLAAKILIGVGAGLASIIGVLHLLLFLLRCVAAWKSQLWERPLALRVPTGELTFQFTIRFLQQESPGVVRGNDAAPTPPSN